MADDKTQAKSAFQNSVLNILKGLYPLPVEWPQNSNDINHILRNRFPDFQIAVQKYRSQLNSSNQTALSQAWINYYNAYGNEEEQCYHHYMGFQTETDNSGKVDYEDPKELFKKNIDALLEIGDPIFESLTFVLEDSFDKPLSDLTVKQRELYDRDFFPHIWDKLTPYQRRYTAEQMDYQHDPAMEEDRQFWWDFYIRMDELKQQVNEWKDISASTAQELKQKETRLQELDNEIARMENQRLRAERKGVQRATEYTPPSGYIAFPLAYNRLVARLETTSEEIAAWIWQGPNDGGLAAYLNINELDPPPEFYYDYTMGEDYLSPLMACWFKEDDITNFKPADRYITGKVLIKRWGELPGIQVEAFIRAKIAESRLVDTHPTYGGTQGSNPHDDSFPALETGLFVLSDVESIEAEDFKDEQNSTNEKKVILQTEPEVGSYEWRRQTALKAANAKHDKPGGSREKQKKIRDIWASGKYSTRDICAEQECAALEMSFSAARKALRNTPPRSKNNLAAAK